MSEGTRVISGNVLTGSVRGEEGALGIPRPASDLHPGGPRALVLPHQRMARPWFRQVQRIARFPNMAHAQREAVRLEHQQQRRRAGFCGHWPVRRCVPI